MSAVAKARVTRDVVVSRIKETHNLGKNALTTEALRLTFQARYKNLEHLYAQFETLHSTVLDALAITKEPDLASEDLLRKKVDEEYYAVEALYAQLFPTPEPKPTPAVITAQPSSPQVKLPKINLPHFDGNVKSWPTFRDLYLALIHTNSSLSPIEKFQYLLTTVSGEPAALVRALPLTADNYFVAYTTLEQRYQNTRSLATLYWREIQNFPVISSESPASLRKLLTVLSENLEALRQLKFPVDQWDFILFNVVIDKLDRETHRAFELKSSHVELPTFTRLKTFLLNHCQALETLPAVPSSSRFTKAPSVKSQPPTPTKSPPRSTLVAGSEDTRSSSGNGKVCPACDEIHAVSLCPMLLAKSPKERFDMIKNKGLCLNCLSKFHRVDSCPSKFTCRTCKAKHHTLLHFLPTPMPSSHGQPARPTVPTPHAPTPETLSSSLPHTSSALANTTSQTSTVLLSTVLVDIIDHQGSPHSVRALLDSASQSNFITTKCANRLGLSRRKSNTSLLGLGNVPSVSAKGSTTCTIRPSGQLNPSLNIDADILDRICADMPSTLVPIESVQNLSNLHLADPTFNIPAPIDMLLGAEIFPRVLKGGILVGSSNEPTAINTIFGWIVMGKTGNPAPPSLSSLFVSTTESLDSTLRRFWEVEEVPFEKPSSSEDTLCEQIYQSTTCRMDTGRYVVSLPFRQPEPKIIGTRDIALRRFLSLERRLTTSPELSASYRAFMQDYLDQNHMHLVAVPLPTEKVYYLPHHGVVKTESRSTKLRVVFDASTKGVDTPSLNDTLLTGPKLQQDIASILLNFRCHKVALTADIQQMYRQILVDPAHQPYQRILWRFKPSDPIQDFQLTTVTYGISSAPFLALRTLNQLAQDENSRFPRAASLMHTDVYVDDIVTGCDSVETALSLQTELTELLNRGGFRLHKWASNHPPLNSPFNPPQPSRSFDEDTEPSIKILGLRWNPHTDVFEYKVETPERHCTKRTILSDLARIFDPLGFLAPITFFCKHLIQHLWCLGINWDGIPLKEVLVQRQAYKDQLSLISLIQIPRRILIDDVTECQLHGFCDASERGYAAVIYLRAADRIQRTTVSLVCAKSKVAPLKSLSVPRLELCAAHLLAMLMQRATCTTSNLTPRASINTIFAWSDSTVALQWMKSPPYRWKTFVANRVSAIQSAIPPESWHHIRSQENPADCASRGLLPAALTDHPLWWSGPTWLRENQNSWPVSDVAYIPENAETTSEQKASTLATFIDPEPLETLLERFSSLDKVLRIILYCRRFAHNSRFPNQRQTGPFSTMDYHEALLILVRRIQNLAFPNELRRIQSKKPCNGPLRKLNPFLDDHGVIRVGGRISHSILPFEQKHPAVLPHSHRITQMIIEDTHKKHLHPGLKTLHFLLSQNFWILSPHRAIRKCLSRCYRCFRVNPRSTEPMMGDLPPYRVQQIKPFQTVGIDYGGPFTIALSKTRNAKTSKAYLCLLVCLATKALHLEVVSALTTDACIAALRRFIARRGRCTSIRSDCGTNFVGAARQLHASMQTAMEAERISWEFNPPSAPHFGGIWEAGIKSAKSHLVRVVGDQILTFEELTTVVTQIEAVLNSRPLCPTSSDPNDLSVLTPGHFLTLEPLTAIPDPDLVATPRNRLDRWQLLQQMHQHFWSRWHTEYLHTLQQRSKWTTNSEPITPGTLVLIKDNTAPPLQWKRGRILQCHPGADGITRVVTLKTSQGVLQRPVVKLCPLPSIDH